MGNIQEYCGNNCINADSNMKLSETTFNQRTKTLNDLQEIRLIKALNYWKKYHKEKNYPFSTRNLTEKIKLLDESIVNNKGKFIDLNVFEKSISSEVLKAANVLAEKEKKFGFVSFENKSQINNNQTNQIIENFLVLRKPVLLNNTGEIYLGFWNLEGEIEGYGKMLKMNGILIEGYFQPNGLCSYGRYFFPNGSFFEGSMTNNEPNSFGLLNFLGETIYFGEWENSEFHGKGKFILKDKLIYEGNFEESYFSGEGFLQYKNPSDINYSYEGNFEKGKFEGKGKLSFAENLKEKETFEGIWINGMPNGKGIYTWSNENFYEGFYEEGKKKGQGKFVFNQGNSFFYGIWSNGKPNGKGILQFEENLKISGVWKQGKIQKIDNKEDYEKLINQSEKLDIPLQSEIFCNDFYLEVPLLSPSKSNLDKILTDENYWKLQTKRNFKAFSRGLGEKIKNEFLLLDDKSNGNI